MHSSEYASRTLVGGASVAFVLMVLSADSLVCVSSLSACTSRDCQLPDCFCPGLDPPGDIPVDQIPQMVVLTFDDAVLAEFKDQVYERIFGGGSESRSSSSGERGTERHRRNPNGCPIHATFYVSHNGTDYDLVRRLHHAGHEMASHSVTHRLPQSYWTSASYNKWRTELAGQRDNLVRLAHLDTDEGEHESAVVGDKSSVSRSLGDLIVGVRAPFLETGGDEQFRMMIDERFVYDSSMMTGPHKAGAVWPFTLDYPPSVEFCSNNK